MVDDPALDAIAAFLKSLSDHALGSSKSEADEQRRLALSWMRHLTLGASHPTDSGRTARDFGGAKRFAASALAQSHATYASTTSQLRDTTWAMVSNLSAALADEQTTQTQAEARLQTLRQALETDSLQELRRATQTVCRDLFAALETQKRRSAERQRSLSGHLPALVGMIEADAKMNTDEVTGFYDRQSLRRAAEHLLPVAAVSGEPVAVIILSLPSQSAAKLSVLAPLNKTTGATTKPDCDALMQVFAKGVSGAFLRNVDLVGRDDDWSFAVLAADCDVSAARKMSERALHESIPRALPKEWAELRLVAGVAALESSVEASFRAARPEAA